MRLWDWLFPRACQVCGASGGPVCGACEASLEWIRGPGCLQCGAPGRAIRGCKDCVGKPMRFDGAVALGVYSGGMRELILALKHRENRDLAGYFAGRLAIQVRESADIVTCVPMSRLDFTLKGYNHAAALAEDVARIRGLAFDEHLLRKIRRTQKQKALQLPERLLNPQGAFEASERARGKRVLVVDDVLTTGATLSACALPLRNAGARAVRVAVVARG